MAHIRKRYIHELILKGKTLSSLIGVLGHRQVGKTTLAESISDHYVTLDKREDFLLASKEPEAFLKKYSHYFQAIDECQLAPLLFPALKEQVRKDKKPGQYLLTGSVRFTSRKAIKESLTGRLLNFELLPLTVSEMAHEPLPTTLTPFFEKNQIDKILQSITSRKNKLTANSKEYSYYFEHGGLPGICFIQNKKMRALKIKEQLSTLLERDIRLIFPTTLSSSQVFELAQFIARNQGQRFSYARAQEQVGITVPTIKKLLYAFEAIFLVRRIKVEGSYKGEIFYLEDQAESLFLSQGSLGEQDSYEQLIYRNIRAQLFYDLGRSFREFYFETRGGARVPYAIESNDFRLGIIPIVGDLPNRIEKSAAASFLKKYNQSRALFLTHGKTAAVIDEKSIVAPCYWFI